MTIIEFTDLQCPYCARFALETWPILRARYVETGKVHFVARDLPLSFHEFALPAAVAARCAGEQGRFWEYREALFRGQSKLATAPYDEIARRFGLDVARFRPVAPTRRRSPPSGTTRHWPRATVSPRRRRSWSGAWSTDSSWAK